VTDGTSAGTSELVVAGAYISGLIYQYASPDFTVLGSKLLFIGQDTSGHLNLWVTDGTAAGTSEVQVAGASASGLLYSGDPDFRILGTKVLFAAHDTTGDFNLWVTDGTSAGTSELTAAAGYQYGLFYYSVNPDFTVLGSKALFDGVDANGHENLWVTDGTSAGTSELMVLGGDPSGLFYFENKTTVSPDFTVFGNRALFDAEDASAKFNLWVTDGTSAGTSELAVAGANSDFFIMVPSLQTPISPCSVAKRYSPALTRTVMSIFG
jgi:ELWxxDGT repeat protein